MSLPSDSHQSTFQASYLKKQLYLDKDLVSLNLWDTAGQEKFHALGPIYYRGANGALLVYDVTNPDSLTKVKDWTKELNKMEGIDKIKLSIIGNKLDLLTSFEQRAPTTNPIIQEALRFTHETINAKHYLTSAKLNQGIGDLFISLSRRMIEHHIKTHNENGKRTYSRGPAWNRATSVSTTDDRLTVWRPEDETSQTKRNCQC